MKWISKSLKNSIELDTYELINYILGSKAISIEHKALGQSLTEQLGRTVLPTMCLQELITLGIYLGYNYRIFIEKNNVEVVHDTDNATGTDSSVKTIA